uniref:Aldo_ket_red domain-containing protein n=1 Tax=Mesocestoides corti TaxID=53468 RepID=A0A5K3EYX0_MESCO
LAVEDVAPAVTAALEVGYRHIDCAHLYLNEEAVGNALKQWLDQTKTNREDVFITSKNTFHRPEFVGPACRASLERLKLSYLDLYLIHWPVAYKPGDDLLPVDEKGNTLFDDVDIITTWKAMEALVTEGLVRHIGLSNFNELQIQRIIDCANIKPVLLQIESNPYFPNQALIDFARANGIVSAAYAPLGSPYRDANDRSCRLIDDPVLATIAKKYGKTPAQVAIRHGIQRGVSVVPKSRTPERIRENFEVFDFELTEEEMGQIATLGSHQRQVRADPMRGNPEFPFLDLL